MPAPALDSHARIQGIATTLLSVSSRSQRWPWSSPSTDAFARGIRFNSPLLHDHYGFFFLSISSCAALGGGEVAARKPRRGCGQRELRRGRVLRVGGRGRSRGGRGLKVRAALHSRNAGAVEPLLRGRRKLGGRAIFAAGGASGSISDRMNWKTHPKYHPNALGFYKIYICSRILHTEKPLHP